MRVEPGDEKTRTCTETTTAFIKMNQGFYEIFSGTNVRLGHTSQVFDQAKSYRTKRKVLENSLNAALLRLRQYTTEIKYRSSLRVLQLMEEK